MIKKLSKNRQKGFTLIEVIISATIIAVLTGISLANYHSAGQRTELNIFMQQMASDIRLMQSYALSSYEYEDTISSGGWGFYVNNVNNNYVLFADNSNDEAYDGISEHFKTVNFPDGIEVESIIGDLTGLENSVNITFVPPKPTTNIGNNLTANDNNDVIIILKDNRNNITRNIEINYFGLIDVQRN